MKKKKIILADDLAPDSKRSEKVRKATEFFANYLSEQIELVYVDAFAPNAIFKSARKSAGYQKLVKQFLNDQKMGIQKSAQSSSIKVSPRVIAGESAAAALLRLSKKTGQYDFIACGTHGRTGLSRMFLGSVAEEVIRQSMIPVMTLGPHAHALPPTPVFRILIPTMLTEQSARAERFAVQLATRLASKVGAVEIVLIHSLHESLHPVVQTAFLAPGAFDQLGGYFETLKKEAEIQLKKRSARLQTKTVAVKTLLDDRTLIASDAVLAACAEVKANLIVMGTHGRNALAGAFLGRTARDVVLGSPVPVFTVRSAAKS